MLSLVDHSTKISHVKKKKKKKVTHLYKIFKVSQGKKIFSVWWACMIILYGLYLNE